MSRQWLRDLRLVASGSGGTFDLSGLRVVFDVEQEHTQAPNRASIFVYNVSRQTAKQFTDKEFTRVQLEAGYRDNLAGVFSGNIKLATYGHDTPTETLLSLYCGDGDEAYNSAFVQKTLAAGSTPRDHVDEAAKEMRKHGVELGYIAGLPDFRHPSPITLFQPAKQVLRDICEFAGASWSIQDEKLQIVPKKGNLPGQPVELNSTNGLIQRPVQTPGGIFVRCLLRPEMKVNGTIKINNASVQLAAPDLSIREEVSNEKLPSLAGDGLYKVLVIRRIGDTHGRPWYNEMLCLAADGSGWTPNNLIQYMTQDFAPGAKTN